MAQLGYPASKFRAGASEAYAESIAGRPTLLGELDAWLSTQDPDALAHAAGYSHAAASLGYVVVTGMELVEKALDALGPGPMDEALLSAVGAEDSSDLLPKELEFIEARFGKGHPALRRRYSLKLANDLCNYIGPMVQKTTWWKENGKAFRSASAKNRAIKQVMEE